MARIRGVSAGETGREMELTYGYARSALAELAGRETERMLEPLELYAHVPGLLRGRFNLALGVGSAGLSEGMVCAVPERSPEPAPAA